MIIRNDAVRLYFLVLWDACLPHAGKTEDGRPKLDYIRYLPIYY